MPLDPLFAERLRVHRKYLISRALKGARERVRDSLGRLRRLLPGLASAPVLETSATVSAGASVGAAAITTAPKKHAPSELRARHRRAALDWDRKELREVGSQGPELRTVEHAVAVPGYPSVTVRIYYPDATDAAADLGAPTAVPAWLSFYGGAFRIGGIDYPTTDAAHRRRAAAAGVAMVAVGYSLAPEHRFPTAVEQGHAALVWLHEHASELGLDPDRIGLAGVSAGAGIAAAVAIANRDRTGIPIRLQVLEVPVTDLTGKHIDFGATRALGIPRPLAVRELRSIARTYLANPADARNPLASPLLAPTLVGLPEAVILTAEYDALRGDGAAYAARLRAEGVDASIALYLGVTHDIPMFTGALASARRWERDVVANLARLHEG